MSKGLIEKHIREKRLAGNKSLPTLKTNGRRVDDDRFGLILKENSKMSDMRIKRFKTELNCHPEGHIAIII